MLNELRKLWRQKRVLEFEQLVGFALIAGTAALYFRAPTDSLLWIGERWGVPELWQWFTLFQLSFGYCLCWTQLPTPLTFAALSSPFLVFGILSFSYSVVNGIGFYVGGAFTAFWVILVFAYVKLWGLRLWMRQFSPS